MNKVFFHRPKLRDLLKIKSDMDFQFFLVSQAMSLYEKVCKKRSKKLGTVLSLGSNQVEARNLPKYSFEKIVLSNFGEPDETTIKATNKKDKRISHIKQNIELLNLKSGSYDLVFCKETLHHIPRPILGLYEMLRVCRRASIIIEPHETAMGNVLEKFGIATKHEGDITKMAKKRRHYDCCYVYRWNKKELVKMLNSYYLESGYELHIMNFWLSNRGGISRNTFLKIVGWLFSFVPFNRGNFMIAMIVPGASLPPEVEKV